LLSADAPHPFEIDFELIDSTLDSAPIRFELRFAWSASSDAAAKLRHGFASPGKTGQHVLKLRQFHLELPFPCAGVPGKNVEDELRAIEDTARQSRLKIAKLRGRKVVIEEHQVGAGRRRHSGNLFNFACTNQCCGIRSRATLQKLGCHVSSRAPHQLAKLGQGFFGIEAGTTWS
jgi:hypothetical protein